MTENTGAKSYQSYLIRCFLEKKGTSDTQPTWRFILQEIAAEPQEHGFGDFNDLAEHLLSKLYAAQGYSNHSNGPTSTTKGEQNAEK